MIPTMGSLALFRVDDVPATELARWSRAWDRPAQAGAELIVATVSGEIVALGAFQRTSEVEPRGRSGVSVVRGSGGAAAAVDTGTVWMQLSLARPDALVACTADKLLNRYLRPLLRALTRVLGVPVSYFGRDWLSAARRPIALVAFAHEASSGRSFVEAIVSVRSSFALSRRSSFLGKEPATLEEIVRRSIDPRLVADAIADAYRDLTNDLRELASFDLPTEPGRLPKLEERPAASPCEWPWAATREEALGTIGAGRDAAGRIRVGGEWMVSRDALLRLEELVAALPSNAAADDVGLAVDEALTTQGAVTFGVRSLVSIRDVILFVLKGTA